jgi:hypothetical protein
VARNGRGFCDQSRLASETLGKEQDEETTTAVAAKLLERTSGALDPDGVAMVAPSFPKRMIAAVIERFFGELHLPVRKNLTLLVLAFISLTASLRSGYGALTLAAVARALPLATSFKDRYKRLNRFLDNPLFDPQGLTDGLFGVLLGTAAASSTIPVILDQSTIGAAQLLLAGVPIAGRVLPLALMTFTYEDIQNRPDREKSQNYIERLFIFQLLEAAKDPLRLCFILDRGYARINLICDLLAQPRTCFVLRTKRNVIIQRIKHGLATRCSVGSLKAGHGIPRRLERVRYCLKKPIELDLIIYYERGHKEPWYLLVPPGSSEWLPTEEVVKLYRRRMHIEQGFRDFKTHLGVRGLRLQVRVSERIQRLLMAFTLAYALVVALGTTKTATDARARLEDARCESRHGTQRILSVRTVAALLLNGRCPELLLRVTREIHCLLKRTLMGRGLYHLALAP